MRMKMLLISVGALAFVGSAQADEFDLEPMCKVEVCNKLERFTLDPFAYLRDQMGETCMDIIIPKSKAVAGSILSAESRWYQGSFNPTKQSVTRVKRVIKCQEK